MRFEPKDYLRPDVIAQIRRLDIRTKVILSGYMAGRRRALLRGLSADFSGHKPYQTGDDIRRIDWNVHARTDRYYVRQYEAETARDVWLVPDSSASMAYRGPDEPMTKFDYSLCVAAALAWLLLNRGDAVGVLSSSERGLIRRRPRCGRRQLTKILAGFAAEQPRDAAEIGDVLRAAAIRVKRRGLIVIFSDCIGRLDSLDDGIARLKHRGHDIILMQTLSSAELTLPFSGPSVFRDPESGLEFAADPDVTRDTYQSAVQAHCDSVNRTCKMRQADYILMDTSEPFDEPLNALLTKRRV
ncbi:MAG: DUF58 domain-containing protein [Planctomycetota bacterium]